MDRFVYLRSIPKWTKRNVTLLSESSSSKVIKCLLYTSLFCLEPFVTQFVFFLSRFSPVSGIRLETAHLKRAWRDLLSNLM